MSGRRTIDQRRAAHALGRQQGYARNPAWRPKESAFWDDYCAAANGLPPTIRINGLILAVASEIKRAGSAGEDGHYAVLADLVSWLVDWARHTRTNWFDGIQPAEEGDIDKTLAGASAVLELLIGIEQRRYRVIDEETLSYLGWLKTLAAPNKKPRSRADDATAGDHGGEADTAGPEG